MGETLVPLQLPQMKMYLKQLVSQGYLLLHLEHFLNVLRIIYSSAVIRHIKTFDMIGISGSSGKSGNGNTKFYVDSSWNNNGQVSRGGSSGISSLSPSSSSAGTISPPNIKHDHINNFSSVITNKPHQVNGGQDQQDYCTPQRRKKSSVTRPTEAPPAPPKM